MEKNTARPRKLDTIRRVLCEGVSLNRFEAERYGDHCLNSTIAELKNRQQLAILSEWETVPNRFGDPVRVKRYWLELDGQDNQGSGPGGTLPHEQP